MRYNKNPASALMHQQIYFSAPYTNYCYRRRRRLADVVVVLGAATKI